MKEYNKEKLHEYAKELFALCLEKGIAFEVSSLNNKFLIYDNYKGWIKVNIKNTYEMEKLIEKVKQS